MIVKEPAWRRYLNFWRRNIEADVDDEVRFHLAMRVEELVSRGMPRDEALAAARRQFGDVAGVRKRLVGIDRRMVRRKSRSDWWSALRQDLRFATRGLRNEPVFAIAVVLTLGLGIGANTAMFGVVDKLLFRAPPGVRDVDRVMRVYLSGTSELSNDVYTSSVTNYPTLAELRRVRSFEQVAGYSERSLSVGEGRDAWSAWGSIVTPDFFTLLGARPVLGRFFLAEEEQKDYDNPGVVLSHRTWRTRFGADAQVIGRTLLIEGRRYSIVGVSAEGFTGVDLNAVDLWLPIGSYAKLSGNERYDWRTDANSFWLTIVAKLRPGVDAAVASTEATPAYHRALALNEYTISRASPAARVKLSPVIGARDHSMARPADAQVAAWLAGLALVVLVIACANVGNLLLLRAIRRRREIALRRALGMSQSRLVGQLLVESALLAVLGGLVAVLATRWVGAPLRALLIPNVAWEGGAVDARVLAVTAASVLGVTLLTALLPAFNVGKTDLTAELKSGGHGLSRRRSRTQSVLLLVQTTLSLTLLSGAGLFLRSVERARSIDLGFDADRVLIAQVSFPSGAYRPDQINAFHDRALERLRQIPGVESASFGEADPFGWSFGGGFRVPGRGPVRHSGGGPYVSAITPDFFETMGTSLARGRTFTEADRLGAPPVVIINEALARYYWPEQNPIGQCVEISTAKGCARIVGVVESTLKYSIQQERRLDFFVPLAQDTGSRRGHALFVRTRAPADRFVNDVRRALQELSPNLPYATVESLQSRFDPHLRSWKLGATALSAFGILALLLAGLGLFSVVAYSVSQRVHEMGIRLALGAQQRDVIRLVLREGVQVPILGAVSGGAMALLLGRFMQHLLYETEPYDPVVISVAAAALLATAIAATSIPAWRASRVDPAAALRVE